MGTARTAHIKKADALDNIAYKSLLTCTWIIAQAQVDDGFRLDAHTTASTVGGALSACGCQLTEIEQADPAHAREPVRALVLQGTTIIEALIAPCNAGLVHAHTELALIAYRARPTQGHKTDVIEAGEAFQALTCLGARVTNG